MRKCQSQHSSWRLKCQKPMKKPYQDHTDKKQNMATLNWRTWQDQRTSIISSCTTCSPHKSHQIQNRSKSGRGSQGSKSIVHYQKMIFTQFYIGKQWIGFCQGGTDGRDSLVVVRPPGFWSDLGGPTPNSNFWRETRIIDSLESAKFAKIPFFMSISPFLVVSSYI